MSPSITVPNKRYTKYRNLGSNILVFMVNFEFKLSHADLTQFILKVFNFNFIKIKKRGSLDKIIARREMSPDGKSKLFDDKELYLWSNDILSALVYIRQKNIVHRDVKPQ